MVGVDLDGVAPMNAVGDGHRKEEDGMTGELGEAGSGVKKEQMMIIELLELHDTGFDETLAIAQGLMGGAKIGLGGGVSAIREFLNNFLKLVKIEVDVFFNVLWLDRSLLCHFCFWTFFTISIIALMVGFVEGIFRKIFE